MLPILPIVHANTPRNLLVSRNFMEIDGCARLRDLVFAQIRIYGHINAFNCEFDNLYASGFLQLVSSHVKESIICKGELTLKDSLCAKVSAIARLIVLEDAHIDELIIEQLIIKNRKTRPPKIILKGKSSIGSVTFAKMAGTICLASAEASIGTVTNGSVLQQLPGVQKSLLPHQIDGSPIPQN